MVKNMPHQLCFTWPTNMVYRGMKKGETEPQEKQKWLQRNKARSQRTMSQCLAFSIIHSFAGQHPLFKSILERVRCLRGNTSMEAQDQIWMRKAVMKKGRKAVPNTSLCFSILNLWASITRKIHFPSKTKFAYMHCLLPPPSDYIWDVH